MVLFIRKYYHRPPIKSRKKSIKNIVKVVVSG
nr:MAG TPA: hypothetical protein [Caudoviricetes sp.]